MWGRWMKGWMDGWIFIMIINLVAVEGDTIRLYLKTGFKANGK